MTLDRRDNHIIDLIFASVIILIDDLQAATAFVTIENILTGAPEMTTLHVQGCDDFSMARVEGKELRTLLIQSF